MRVTGRRAVSPIIATLLLIAIAVAAAIIVYVFVSSISGNLAQQGGQQVADQVSMDAYNYPSPYTAPVMVMRNVGSSSITISQIYFNGNLCQGVIAACQAPSFASGTCTTGATSTCTAGQYTQLTLTVTSPGAGTSSLIRLVTSDGGTFTFSIIAGRSG